MDAKLGGCEPGAGRAGANQRRDEGGTVRNPPFRHVGREHKVVLGANEDALPDLLLPCRRNFHCLNISFMS